MLHLVSHPGLGRRPQGGADGCGRPQIRRGAERARALPSVGGCRVVTLPKPLSPRALARLRASPRSYVPTELDLEARPVPARGGRAPGRRARRGRRCGGSAATCRSAPVDGDVAPSGGGRHARVPAPAGVGAAARGVRRGALAAGPGGPGRGRHRRGPRRGGLRAAGGVGPVRRRRHRHRARRRVAGRADRGDGRCRPGRGGRYGGRRRRAVATSTASRRRGRRRRRRGGAPAGVVVVHVVGPGAAPGRAAAAGGVAGGRCRRGGGRRDQRRPTCRALNLARVLVDGEQVRVPAVGDPADVTAPGAGAGERAPGERAPAARRVAQVSAQHGRPRRARHPARGGPGAGPAHPRLAHRARPVHQRRRARRGERHRREAARPAQPPGDAVSRGRCPRALGDVGPRRLRGGVRSGDRPAAARRRPCWPGPSRRPPWGWHRRAHLVLVAAPAARPGVRWSAVAPARRALRRLGCARAGCCSPSPWSWCSRSPPRGTACCALAAASSRSPPTGRPSPPSPWSPVTRSCCPGAATGRWCCARRPSRVLDARGHPARHRRPGAAHRRPGDRRARRGAPRCGCAAGSGPPSGPTTGSRPCR